MKSGNRSFLIRCAITADENNSCGAKPRNGNLSIGTWRMGGGDKDETNEAGNLGHRDTDSHVFCPTAARLGCSNILARKSERDPICTTSSSSTKEEEVGGDCGWCFVKSWGFLLHFLSSPDSMVGV